MKARALLWFRLLTGREEATTHGQLRNRRIGRGFLSSVAQKATGLAVSIISVPLTVHYLGDERYGLWMAITSVLGWLALSDLGLSTSLGLAVADAYGRDDRAAAQRAVASAFYALCAITLVLAILFLVAAPFIPWSSIFKVSSPLARAELLPAIGVAFFLFVLNFPLSIAGRVLAAYQEFVTANLWLIAGNLLTLAALVLACWLKAGLPVLIACFSGVSVFLSLALALWLFRHHKPWLAPARSAFEKKRAHALMGKGFWFFAAGIAYLLIYQTDIAIISHFRGVAHVTEYSIAARLFSYTALLQIMLAGTLSLSYTEAQARGDIPWMRKTLWRHAALCLVTTLILCTACYFAAPLLIAKWTLGAVTVSPTVLFWMAAWQCVFALSQPFAIFLGGIGKPRGMALYGGATGILNVILGCLWVQEYGVAGVVAATAISCILVNIPFTMGEAIWQMWRLKTIPSENENSYLA